MLEKLTAKQARRIAECARAARDARDVLLHGIAEDTIGEPHPAKGERDRIGTGGFDVLPASDRSVRALSRAINDLRPDARSELFALMRVGQGELAPEDWTRGMSEATTLGDESVSGILADDIDLSNHLNKGLYELGLS